MRVVMADIITADNVRALNTYAEPNTVCAHPMEITLPSFTVPKHSVVRVVLEK